jgi:acetolactate synthase-1/2/3 large subunit
MTTTMRGAEIVAEMLVRLGVTHVSGIPGHTVLDFVDAVYDRQDHLTAVLPRNEETAAFASDAFYRVSHRPMVAFAHISVGSANLLTGVTNAYLDSSAMIVITGESWSRIQGRGAYQELARDRDAGTPDMFRGSVKRSWQVHRADRLLETVLKAYRLATSGRPGPVHLDVTQDAWADRVEVSLPSAETLGLISAGSRASAPATEAILDLLEHAKRPAILAGGGAVLAEASEQLTALAEALRAPVATTVMGKGAIAEDHPLAMGISGWIGTEPANTALRECDVLLALGTRFAETDTSAWQEGKPFAIPPTRLIQIDIDPGEISKYYPAEIGAVGDIRAVLEDLVTGLKHRSASAPRSREDWIGQLSESKARWRAQSQQLLSSDASPIQTGRVVGELRAALPENGLVISDVGNAHKWIAQQFAAIRPRSVLSTMGGAAMGFGPCGAVGAQLAAPGRPVVSWVGDGSMSMSLHVLPTVVEYNLPITYVVVNDAMYGAVKRPQDTRYGPGRNLFSVFQTQGGDSYRLDCAAIASAMGMEAQRVTSVEEIGPALRRGIATPRPFLVDIDVDPATFVPMTGGGTFVMPALG